MGVTWLGPEVVLARAAGCTHRTPWLRSARGAKVAAQPGKSFVASSRDSAAVSGLLAATWLAATCLASLAEATALGDARATPTRTTPTPAPRRRLRTAMVSVLPRSSDARGQP